MNTHYQMMVTLFWVFAVVINVPWEAASSVIRDLIVSFCKSVICWGVSDFGDDVLGPTIFLVDGTIVTTVCDLEPEEVICAVQNRYTYEAAHSSMSKNEIVFHLKNVSLTVRNNFSSVRNFFTFSFIFLNSN